MNKQMMKSMMVACMAVFAFAAPQAEAAVVNISVGCQGVQVRVADNCCSAAKKKAEARRYREAMARREAARREAARREAARRAAARRYQNRCAFCR